MNIKKFAAAVLPMLALGLSLAACSSPPSEQQTEQNQQVQDAQRLENAQPIPQISYSQERQALIDAELAAASGSATTSFFFNQGVQNPINSCPSIGMGVPDSAQISNPSQVVGVSSRIGGGHDVLPLMDPDGIYAPTSSTGTWVNCVNAQGQQYVVRWEGFVYTVDGSARWDNTTHSIVVLGAPTYKIDTLHHH